MKCCGQDIAVIWNQLAALFANIVSWFCSFWHRVPDCVAEIPNGCVAIVGPGGAEKLQLRELPGGSDGATVGYNIPKFKSPFVENSNQNVPEDGVIVRTSYFSVNYADVCIRWGLYESALRYVGWPIVPGFDFSGVVEVCGSKSGFRVGDRVFGYTMFGAYSSRILVPSRQIRRIPENLQDDQIAGVPAVAATALHCIHLAGAWAPKSGGGSTLVSKNKACLIHSAAGGVGSMLIQMCKVQGYSPIVAVVGSSHKISYCVELGADYVIDKSKSNLWVEAEKFSPGGYAAVFDANGIETLQHSNDHLCQNGRLVIFGFHTNLPQGADLLSPTAWVKMAFGLLRMPKYDPMELVLSSKTVCGFNLSFFADEHELIDSYMLQLVQWLADSKITPSKVTCYPLGEIRKAHAHIQSGRSVGKIVVRVANQQD